MLLKACWPSLPKSRNSALASLPPSRAMRCVIVSTTLAPNPLQVGRQQSRDLRRHGPGERSNLEALPQRDRLQTEEERHGLNLPLLPLRAAPELRYRRRREAGPSVLIAHARAQERRAAASAHTEKLHALRLQLRGSGATPAPDL